MAVVDALPRTMVDADTGSRRTRKRGRVRLFGKWCKGCGLCIAFCPQQVFGEDKSHRPVVLRPDRCIACGWCVVHCPDFAITVETVYEADGEVDA